MFTRYCYTIKKSGFTLLEVMLCLMLGLLLVSLLFETYCAAERSFRTQIALTQIENHASMAMDILASEIHQSGYIGCAHLSNQFTIISHPAYSITPENQIMSYHLNEITIRHAGKLSAELIASIYDAYTLYASSSVRFSSGDVLIISDCKQAEIFKVADVHHSLSEQKIISETPLHFAFDAHAEIAKLEINTFFIRKTDRFHEDGTPIYSLFVENIKHHKTELIEDIDEMQVIHTSHPHSKHVMIRLEMISPFIKKNWYLYAASNASSFQ